MKANSSKPAIFIPEPCHEDWKKMTPKEQGRHCAMCNKVVVDFTGYSKGQVIDFIQARPNEKVCGRVAPEIVSPNSFVETTPPTWDKLKIFACAVFMIFGTALFGYGQKGEPVKMGKVQVQHTTPPPTMGQVAVKDTAQTPQDDYPYGKLGELIVEPSDSIPKATPVKGNLKIAPQKAQPLDSLKKCDSGQNPPKEEERILGMIQYKEK